MAGQSKRRGEQVVFYVLKLFFWLLCENEIGTGGKGDIRKTRLEDNIILKQEIASPK